jgi:predicted transcriptional regulator
VVGDIVRDFLDRVFDGAAAPLLLHLAKEGRLSKEERRLIRRITEGVDE